MGEGSSGPDPAPPTGAGDGRATEAVPGYRPTEVARHNQPTEVMRPYQPTADATPQPPSATETHQPQAGIVRYGPGVPATPPPSQAGVTAERIWRTAHLPEPPRRRVGLRRLFGAALTVILLAVSGVVLFLRFYHAPFHVTAVTIAQQTKTVCGVDVTGRITTNGSAGTVSYQWLFRPDRQAPQPLSQSVVAGQHAVYVTVAVQGQGHGSASQTVTLQILGPDPQAASTAFVVSC